MNSVHTIPLLYLALAFLPVALVLGIMYKWSLDSGNALYALIRMLGQLLFIGYFLAVIFQSDSPWVVLLIVAIMMLASSWIALRTVALRRLQLFPKALLAIALGGGLVLIFITQIVLRLQPWYLPQYVIPLSGMIFATSMNSVSLAAERLQAELEREVDDLQSHYLKARNIAFSAALIPVVNSLFAVGLVSLPGMMTGQILAGVSPLIAVRYQVMVMCMTFAAAGISAACFLLWARPVFESQLKAFNSRT